MIIHGAAVSWLPERCTFVPGVNSSIEIVLVGTADPDTLRSD
jgi:hypothetical protein